MITQVLPAHSTSQRRHYHGKPACENLCEHTSGSTTVTATQIYIVDQRHNVLIGIFSRLWINRVWLPILLVVDCIGKIVFSLSAFAPENLVSRGRLGHPVSWQQVHYLHSLRRNLVLTPGILSAFRDGVHIMRRQSPSGQYRVNRVTQAF